LLTLPTNTWYAPVREYSTLPDRMADDDTDEALMLRYQSGDAGAFDLLYARHRGPLFRFMLRQCRVREHCEELFQDVWMSMIDARSRYRVEAQFRTWLYTIAHNKLMDYFRSHSRREWTAFETDEETSSPLDNARASRVDEPLVRAEARQQGEAILRLLAALPAPQREAFLLYEEGGLGVEEIAAATGTSFEAAKSRLRYAIAKLRDGLREFA